MTRQKITACGAGSGQAAGTKDVDALARPSVDYDTTKMQVAQGDHRHLADLLTQARLHKSPYDALRRLSGEVAR
jgi:hypothetical protein